MTKNIKKTEILQICGIKVPLAREFILEEDNIIWLMEGFDGLKNIVYDCSTQEGIGEAKKLKTAANKFIKEFKAFCDPLEEEGKAIAKTRSQVKLKLEATVDHILKPISDIEDKLKDLRTKMGSQILNLEQCEIRLKDVEELKKFKWLAFEEEAIALIDQYHATALLVKSRLEAELKAKEEAETKARLEREEVIRQEAVARAKADAQKEIDAANKKVEEVEIKLRTISTRAIAPTIMAGDTQSINIGSVPDLSIEDKKKIHNEILLDLSEFFFGSQDEAKKVINAIAKGKIRHLSIKY